MRKFILAIALLLGIIFLFSRFTEIQNVVATLQRGVIWFILAGILIETIWYINVAASYRYIYQSLGMEEKTQSFGSAVNWSIFRQCGSPFCRYERDRSLRGRC